MGKVKSKRFEVWVTDIVDGAHKATECDTLAEAEAFKETVDGYAMVFDNAPGAAARAVKQLAEDIGTAVDKYLSRKKKHIDIRVGFNA